MIYYVELIIHFDLLLFSNWYLIPVDRSFKWGRMVDESAQLPILLGERETQLTVTGRHWSFSGVEGTFTYELRHIGTGKSFATIKFNFNRPFDTRRHDFKANIKIEEERVKGFIKTEVRREGHAFGPGTSHVYFKLMKSGDKEIRKQVVDYLRKQENRFEI
jgi:hypothetical protein